MTKNEKISASLKKYFAQNGHHLKDVPGWKHSDESKTHLSEKLKAHYDRVGRKTKAQFNARNKANVYAYRARRKNAVPDDADLKLISLIYENCPEGYHVDHIKSLAEGGFHHQDNLQYLPVSENCRKGKNRKYDPTLVIRWQDSIPS